MKKDVFRRIISAVLAAAVITAGTAASAAGEAIKEGREQASRATVILYEEESMRSTFGKTFKNSDGSYTAVTYGEAVHYKENGEWKEIDNSLEAVTENGRQVYRNRSGGKNKIPQVSFSERDGSVEIKAEGYSASWRLRSEKSGDGTAAKRVRAINESGAAKITVAKGIDGLTAEEKKTAAEKSVSRIVYNKAFGEETQVEYTVTPTKVKEDIIIKSREDIAEYVTELSVPGLTAEREASNAVSIKNAEGETVFELPAPMMYDSAGEVSYEIDTEVIKLDDGEYEIRTAPSKEWLTEEERKYPVTVDPTIKVTAETGSDNVWDTYVAEGDSNYYNNADRMYAGIRNGKRHRIYFKIKTLPSIPTTASIKRSSVEFRLTNGTTTAVNAMSCYAAGSNITTGRINWATAPGTGVLLDGNKMPTQRGGNYYISFDLTQAMRYVYSGSANTGLIIRYANENPSPADYNAVYSSDSTVGLPVFTIEYQTDTTNVNIIDGGVYYIKNPSRNVYLDVDHSGTANYTQVLGHNFNGEQNQRWRIEKQSDGYYTFTPMHNTAGAMVYNGISNGSKIITANNIATTGSSYENYTRWSIVSNGDGTVRIAAKQTDSTLLSKVLDLPGASGTQAQVYEWTGSGNGNQKWVLERATELGGSTAYRQVNNTEINCLGYALHTVSFTKLMCSEDDTLETIYNKTKEHIENELHRECRRVSGQGVLMRPNEYLIAMRVQIDGGIFQDYHYMELTTDGWADKLSILNSRLIGDINPSTYNWYNNRYNSDTIYFVVTK